MNFAKKAEDRPGQLAYKIFFSTERTFLTI